MPKTITIDPITRIEGHAKITIHMDDQGKVDDAFFHVTQYRGFEKLCEGRPFYEMPSLMARICGICPVSHLMASAKACDALMAVQIPETGANLRRIMNLAQIVQSHALSFFHLSSPDLLMGMDADPAQRNIFGVAQQHPHLAKDGIALRKFGQEIIELLGGKRIHPAWVVPGGVSDPLNEERHATIMAALPEARQIAIRTLDWFKTVVDNYREEIRSFGNFPHSSWAWSTKTTTACRSTMAASASSTPPATSSPTGSSRRSIATTSEESVAPWTYLKFPYYKPMGPEGVYRVGPLARLNLIDRCGTPLADQEWAEFRSLERGAVLSSFHFHYARLVEILYCVERVEQLLNDPEILSDHVRPMLAPTAAKASASPKRRARAHAPLQDRRQRPDHPRQPDHCYRPQQHGHEQERETGGQALHQRQQDRRRHAQPRRSGDPHLRSLPELLHPRHRPNAAPDPAHGAGWGSGRRVAEIRRLQNFIDPQRHTKRRREGHGFQD
ncbi:MAG: Ni/Fe hydrogenase subunit alpha [Caldilineaceae bacterium]